VVYVIEHFTILDDWIHCDFDCDTGEPIAYDTREEAEAELQDIFVYCRKEDMDICEDQYRIVGKTELTRVAYDSGFAEREHFISSNRMRFMRENKTLYFCDNKHYEPSLEVDKENYLIPENNIGHKNDSSPTRHT